MPLYVELLELTTVSEAVPSRWTLSYTQCASKVQSWTSLTRRDRMAARRNGSVPNFRGKPVKTHLTTLFTEFLESEQASGVILIVCTLIAIVIANTSFGKG